MTSGRDKVQAGVHAFVDWRRPLAVHRPSGVDTGRRWPRRSQQRRRQNRPDNQRLLLHVRVEAALNVGEDFPGTILCTECISRRNDVIRARD